MKTIRYGGCGTHLYDKGRWQTTYGETDSISEGLGAENYISEPVFQVVV